MSFIGMKIKPKRLFFDRKKVIDSVDRATRTVLSRIGAFIRRTAKSSLKKPTKRFVKAARGEGRSIASIPGRPPFVHVGTVKKRLFFEYDFETRSVVIGPEIFKGRKTQSSPPGLKALEEGGRVRQRRRDRKTKRTEKLSFTIKARPFMGPAFKKEIPKLPAMWRDSVK